MILFIVDPVGQHVSLPIGVLDVLVGSAQTYLEYVHLSGLPRWLLARAKLNAEHGGWIEGYPPGENHE